jgi:hypothetical protein
MLLLALCAAAAGPSVLVLDLKPVDVPAGEARLLTNLVTDAIAENGAGKVVGMEDLRRVIELEAEREAAGCTSEHCLVELAGATGVEYVVFGDVGRLGRAYVLNLRLFNSAAGETVSRTTITTASVDEARQQLGPSIRKLMAPATGNASEPTPPAMMTQEKPMSSLVLIGGITAGAGLIGAVGLGVGALLMDGVLADPAASAADKTSAFNMQPIISGAAIASTAVALGGGAVIAVGMME